MTETITIKELQVSWHLTNLDMVPMVNHSVIQKTVNKQLSGFILDAGDTIMEQGQKVLPSQSSWSPVMLKIAAPYWLIL